MNRIIINDNQSSVNRRPGLLGRLQFKLAINLLSILSHIFPNLIARIAKKLLFTPKKKGYNKSHQELLRNCQTYDMKYRSGVIKVFVWGQGKRVLLVHGWGGNALQLYRFIDPLVNIGYQVITFNAPAHGSSKQSEADVIQFAESILSVSTHFSGIEYLIGYSFGGSASMLAIKNGLSVKKAVFLGSPSQLHRVVDNFGRSLKLSVKSMERLKELSNSELYKSLSTTDSLQKFSSQHLKDWRFQVDLNLMDRVSPIEYVHEFSNPVMIIHDVKDDMVSFKDGYDLYNAISGSKLVITYGFKHRGLIASEKIILNIINYFDKPTQPIAFVNPTIN